MKAIFLLCLGMSAHVERNFSVKFQKLIQTQKKQNEWLIGSENDNETQLTQYEWLTWYEIQRLKTINWSRDFH